MSGSERKGQFLTRQPVRGWVWIPFQAGWGRCMRGSLGKIIVGWEYGVI